MAFTVAPRPGDAITIAPSRSPGASFVATVTEAANLRIKVRLLRPRNPAVEAGAEVVLHVLGSSLNQTATATVMASSASELLLRQNETPEVKVDRRRHPRVPCRLRAFCAVQEGGGLHPYSAVAVDLSLGGIRVQAESIDPRDTRRRIVGGLLLDDTAAVHFVGELRHRAPDRDRPMLHNHGIEFVAMEESDQRQLRITVSRLWNTQAPQR